MVIDSSALVSLLINEEPYSGEISRRIGENGTTLHAPHLVDLEVLNVLRRHLINGDIGEERAKASLRALTAMPIVRYEHHPFQARIWQLCHNLTAYDAVYVALAEALKVPFLTLDRRIAGAPGLTCEIDLVGN